MTDSPRTTKDSASCLKILVVEDDLPTLELMREALTSLDAEVFPISDSEQAAIVVKTLAFDGIFIDLQMPKMDGFTLASKIRESSWNKKTPIIVITAESDREAMDKAFAAGGTFFLSKPVDRQRLRLLLNATRGTMLDNRVRFLRKPFSSSVTGSSVSERLTGTSVNISTCGMLFESNLALRVGDRLRLTFRLASQSRAIEVHAEVRRVDDRGRVGVLFTDINPADQGIIKAFVDDKETGE